MNIIEKKFPITGVTIHPRTARITRDLTCAIKKGENKIIINNLPQDITEESIRIEFEKDSKQKIIDIFSTDDFIEKFNENLYRKKEVELKKYIDKKKRLEVVIKNLSDEFNLFLNKNKLLDSVYENQFKPIDINTWDEFFKFLDEKLKINRDSLRKIIFEWIDLEQIIIASQNNLDKYTSYDQLKEHKIVAIIESNIQIDELISIHYFQNNVKWHPAYTLRTDLNKKSLSINLYAMISQETGEEWENLDILLSTAIPLQNCDIPEIRSKRIKEKKAEIILKKPQEQFRAKQAMNKDMSFTQAKSKAPAPEMQAEVYEEISEQVFEDKKATASAGMTSGASSGRDVRYEHVARQKKLKKAQEPVAGKEIFKAKKLITDIDNNISSVFSLDNVNEYYYDLYNYLQDAFNPDEIASSAKAVNVNQLFLNEIPLFNSIGGYDYRYKVKSKKTLIPSINIPSQISVEINEMPIDLVYITIPIEKECVFLKATFSNKGENPFPAGPAQIFLENNLIGDIIFPTLGQNEGTSISLGIDKDIKVIRKENKKRETKGIVGKGIVTTFDIEIELISYKKESLQIEVIDRIPKIKSDDINIFNINYNPKPSKITLRKILLWDLTLEPNKKKVIIYSYSIKHPENFNLTIAYESAPYFVNEPEEK